jgi:hypothetical protein
MVGAAGRLDRFSLRLSGFSDQNPTLDLPAPNKPCAWESK